MSELVSKAPGVSKQCLTPVLNWSSVAELVRVETCVFNMVGLGGRHSSEEAFALLTQSSRVRFPHLTAGKNRKSKSKPKILLWEPAVLIARCQRTRRKNKKNDVNWQQLTSACNSGGRILAGGVNGCEFKSLGDKARTIWHLSSQWHKWFVSKMNIIRLVTPAFSSE